MEELNREDYLSPLSVYLLNTSAVPIADLQQEVAKQHNRQALLTEDHAKFINRLMTHDGCINNLQIYLSLLKRRSANRNQVKDAILTGPPSVLIEREKWGAALAR